MKKNSEVVKRVKALRKALDMNQLEFAKHGGFPQSRVSEWESGKAPSADAYIRLGNLASHPDNLWFWEQAGLTPQALVAAASKVMRERFSAPPESEIVRVPAYDDLSAAGFASMLALPAKLVPNPGTAYFLRFTEKHDPSLGFQCGDILILDTQDAGSPCLKPFFGHMIVVGNAHKEGQEKLERPLMGRLTLVGIGRRFEAMLWPVGSIVAGRTLVSIADYEVASDVLDNDKAADEALEKIAPSPYLPVLGRVVAYIPSETPFAN